MLYQILGVKCLDFKNDEGEKIQGIKLYCATDSEDEDVFGETVDTFFIPTSSERYSQFAGYCSNAVDIVKLVKTYFDVEFNRKGKPVGFTWLGVDDKDDNKDKFKTDNRKRTTGIIADTTEAKSV